MHAFCLAIVFKLLTSISLKESIQVIDAQCDHENTSVYQFCLSADVPDQVPNFLASRTVLSSSVQSITLTWDMPFDNFLPIVSYEIENCKREPTEIPPQCTANGSIILSPNVTEYTTNVSTDASYQFEITAQNSIGSSNGSIVKVLQREFIS